RQRQAFTLWDIHVKELYLPFKAHTMYIKNRLNSSKIKAFGLYQTLRLNKNYVLRNRLLFIY
ncbi:MAG: hypothetical protein CMC96_03985, partial [Flavobacteriales bacterium]|nr:hypothetical protein [Flavobacteriales bacterium]